MTIVDFDLNCKLVTTTQTSNWFVSVTDVYSPEDANEQTELRFTFIAHQLVEAIEGATDLLMEFRSMREAIEDLDYE